MNHLWRRSAAPAAACFISASSIGVGIASNTDGDCDGTDNRKSNYDRSFFFQQHNTVKCEEQGTTATAKITTPVVTVTETEISKSNSNSDTNGNDTNSNIAGNAVDAPKQKEDKSNSSEQKVEEDDQADVAQFHNLFPLRQLWQPAVEYPLWDNDWDGRKLKSTGDKEKDHKYKKFVRRNGVTKHIILIRHGQYDETHREDEKRILTPLGRKQAELTGKRIAAMIRGFDEQFGPCNVTTVRVSGMARAQETANLIAKELPESVVRAPPDENLNEGRPCHHVPSGRMSSSTIKKVDEDHKRIEAAFKSYFYRTDPPDYEEAEKQEKEEEKVEGGDIAKGKEVPVTDDKQEEVKVVEDEQKPIEPTELKPDPQHEFEIIVCHANVIRYFFCRALQIPPEAWLRLCTFNCSLTYLTIRASGGVSCRMLGDIGHLGHEHSTFSMHHGFNW